MTASRFFDSAGVPIHYVEGGSGAPIVFAHGYSGSLDMWIDSGIFDALARGHHAIAFDMRGHGKSGKPHDPHAYGAEMALDITRLLNHLSLPKANIVGYSMGAHTVAHLLALAPERFITAVLGGGTGRRNWTVDDDQRVEIEAAEMEQGLLTTQILRLWPPGKPRPSKHELRQMSAQALRDNDPLALAAVRRSNKEQVVSAERMAAAGVPILGIVGSADPYLAPFEALKRAMPRMELVVLDGADHGTGPTHPEFVPAISRFIAAHAYAYNSHAPH